MANWSASPDVVHEPFISHLAMPQYVSDTGPANSSGRGKYRTDRTCDTYDEMSWLRAEARSLAFLHMTLVTTPTTYVVRYCNADKEFLPVYLQFRAHGSTLKLLCYLAGLFVVPWICFTLQPYPCKTQQYFMDTDGNAIVNMTPHSYVPESVHYRNASVAMWGAQCEVENWFRSARSLAIGPVCLLVLLAFWSIFSSSQWYGWVSRILLFFRAMMPSIPYNGLGPAWALRGTGGQTARGLYKNTVHEQKWSWWDDLFGAWDIYLFSVMICLALMIAFVLVPSMVGYFKAGISGFCTGFALSGGVVILFSRVIFTMTDRWLGAPSQLVCAVDHELRRTPLPFKDESATIATSFTNAKASVKKMINAEARKLDNTQLARLLEKVDRLPLPEGSEQLLEDMKRASRSSVLLMGLHANTSSMLALTRSELGAIAWSSPVGIVLGMIDPKYEVFGRKPFNFQKSAVITQLFLLDRNVLLVNENGYFRVEEEGSSSDSDAEVPFQRLSRVSAGGDDDVDSM